MIAISYRREDSTPVAGRLHDRLRMEFGKENVFMDFDSIPYGVDFREHIKRTLEQAEVVVAVVGPRWLGDQTGPGARRIDDPSDFVRLEIAGALQRGIPVIPILIDDTPMPKSESLPNEIAGFAFRNALVLDTGIDFHHHADRLVAGIRELLKRGSRSEGPVPFGAAAPVETAATQVARVEAGTRDIAEEEQAAALKLPAVTETPGEAKPPEQESTTRPKRPARRRKQSSGSSAPSVARSTLRPSKLATTSAPPVPLRPEGAGESAKWLRQFPANWKVASVVAVAAAALVLTYFTITRLSRSDRPPISTSNVVESSASIVPTAAPQPSAAPSPSQAAIAAVTPSIAVSVAPTAAAASPSPTKSEEVVLSSPPAVAPTPPPFENHPAGPGYQATIPFASAIPEEENVRQLIRDYYAALSRHDLDAVVAKFGDNVDYQGQGHHDRRYIRIDTGNYLRRWDRIAFDTGPINVSRTPEGDFIATFDFPFAVGQGRATDKVGISSSVWVLRKDPLSGLQILSQREKVLPAGSHVKHRQRRY